MRNFKSFNEYVKNMDEQQLNELLGLLKNPKCPVCGSNLVIDKNVVHYGQPEGLTKSYDCVHCNQGYSLNTKTGVLNKVGNVTFDD